MPYPSQFPYEWLDATPKDNDRDLQRKWGQAMVRRRAQAQEVRQAFDELRNQRTRLGYDVLLVTDMEAPADLGEITARLAATSFLPERPTGDVRVSLALSALAEEQELAAYCRPAPRRELAISPSRHLDAVRPELLPASFDR